MALMDAYRSALSSIAGQSTGLGGLSAALPTIASSVEASAERRRKKQEEEEARQREGNLFALNRAIEEGDEATIMRLGPKVYGAGIDFTAVAQGAKDKKRLADRARDEAEFDRLIRAYSNAADDETKKQLSRAASDVQSRLLGLSPTITREVKDGGLVPSGRKESYTEQVPIVGTGYPAGTIIPFDVARELATPVEKGGAGLVGYFGMAPNAPESRRVLKDIPPVMETVTKDRDIMVPKTEEVPRFDFGSSAAKMTMAEKRKSVLDMQTMAENQWRGLSAAAKKAYRDQYTNYSTALLRAQRALAKGEDIELPEAVSFVGETLKDVEARGKAEDRRTRKEAMQDRLKLALRRLGIMEQSLDIQRINAISNTRKADAAVQNAQTAAERRLDQKERDAFLSQEKVQTTLAKIDKEAVSQAQKEADKLYPADKFASEEEEAERKSVMKTYVGERATAIAKTRAEKYVTEEIPKWQRSRANKPAAKKDNPRGEVKIERVQTRRPPTGGGPESDAPKPGKNAGAFGG